MEQQQRRSGTGPKTSAGKRRAARNGTQHGGFSQPVTWASRYATSVLHALEPADWESVRSGTAPPTKNCN